MKIHEYQAKELLAAAGAPVPKHIVARSPEEVGKAFDELGGSGAMVKAQVHAGGRGAGQLKGYADKLGGVKFAPNKEKAEKLAAAMLSHSLVTKQTGPEGQPIKTLIVQSDAEPEKEFYLGMVLDRAIGLPVMMVSAAGGMDIEEVAEKEPEKILKVAVAPETGLLPFQAQKLAFELGFAPEHIGTVTKVLLAISKVYFQYDASIVEVNPLAITKAGEVVVLDAKID